MDGKQNYNTTPGEKRRGASVASPFAIKPSSRRLAASLFSLLAATLLFCGALCGLLGGRSRRGFLRAPARVLCGFFRSLHAAFVRRHFLGTRALVSGRLRDSLRRRLWRSISAGI